MEDALYIHLHGGLSMNKFKPFIVLGIILFAVTLLVPSILVMPFIEEKTSSHLKEEEKTPTEDENIDLEVAVYREKEDKVEKLQLEEYVVGVVASEMNAAFEPEALKAQALAARTYIIKRLLSDTQDKDLPDGVMVGDSINYQVYYDRDDLRKIWDEKDYDWKIKKIEEAVSATSGQILTYEGNPIDATFFSTSNGYTENAEAIWQKNAIAYLQSVESPWDTDSPKFNGEKVISVTDFENLLGVSLSNNEKVADDTQYTVGKRVASITINDKEVSGEEVRTKLDLKSTDFTLKRNGDEIIITTKGYGHGVGMSQYGANGMAAEGKTYEDIVKYYYQGIEVTNAENILTKYLASK